MKNFLLCTICTFTFQAIPTYKSKKNIKALPVNDLVQNFDIIKPHHINNKEKKNNKKNIFFN